MKNEKIIYPRRTAYIYGIDGLRALAVVMVLAYHLKLPIAQGGLLGVTVFFVISGFLITRILISELENTGTISLRTFWFKRIRRLYPAIFAMVIPLILISAIFNRVLFTKACADLPSALFGYNNWWQIFNNVSYFENAGAPSPLTHCWSLAIETQFYLVYPLLLLILFHLKNGRKIAERTTLILALISVALMWILFKPSGDPSRVYYGTDTRVFSLLTGAFLAFVTQHKKFQKEAARIYDVLGILSLIVLLYMMIRVNGYSSFLYRGGHAIASVLSAFIILSTLNEASFLSRALSLFPLKWIGDRSYSIYLWHYPVILFISGGARSGFFITLAEILLSVILAAGSYRFIETPIRHGVIGREWRIIKSHPRTRRDRIKQMRTARRAMLVGGCTFVLVLSSLLCIRFVPRKNALSDISALEQQAKKATALTETKKQNLKKTNTDSKDTSGQAKGSSKSGANGSQTSEDLHVLLIGDSVAVGATDNFYETFPNSICDAAIGRQATESIPLYQAYVSNQKWKGDGVIFALGSNGVLYDSLKDLRKALGTKLPLFILTVRAPSTAWETSNNEELRKFANTTDNTYLIDWYQASEGHGEYFYDDNTHLTPDGAKAYINCIKDAVSKAFN